uniref:Oligosaccharyltransferase complex subunit n=1 Tax=Plectus sambesii TaxID=2011161 RepID=A0A914WNH5_9BILA
MDGLIESMYFSFLDPPNLRLKRPSWLKAPTPMVLFGVILASYFLVTGGVIYDVINEPPSVGSTTDERGNSRPVAIMQYRVNGQYIMEGLAASFMFTLGGLGFVILDLCNSPLMPKLNRTMMLGLGFSCVLIGFFATRMFMKMKLPGYLMG